MSSAHCFSYGASSICLGHPEVRSFLFGLEGVLTALMAIILLRWIVVFLQPKARPGKPVSCFTSPFLLFLTVFQRPVGTSPSDNGHGKVFTRGDVIPLNIT